MICIQADLLCRFLLNERVHVSSQFNGICILYISIAKTFSLVRGILNKDKQTQHLKYIKGMFSPNTVWLSYFLISWKSLYGKRAKPLEKIFL